MQERLIDDDPILGQFIANYPINRLRLLIPAGAVLLVVWFMTTIALWQVEPALAATITVAIIFVAVLIVGWFVLHLWNREIILYEKGFTYREGSNIAYIRFQEIVSIHQRGQVVSYFGGLLKRSTYQFTIHTQNDETITLNTLYNRLDNLTLRLEQAIMPHLLERTRQQLESGELIQFHTQLSIDSSGLHNNTRQLSWEDFGGYDIKQGKLHLKHHQGDIWLSISLHEIINIRVLLAHLEERMPNR
ncbi:MAG: hypothetical protein Kow00117_14910 [Phototrophicales bacterium]